MRNSDRLRLRLAFLGASTSMRLYFDTDSAVQYAQANFVFTRLGLPLSGTWSDRMNEIEDYFGAEHPLTERQLSDVPPSPWTVYLIEDIYVRIEALSEPTNASFYSAEWASATVPGLRTREWLESISFEDLDSSLASSGGNRRASVYSMVTLHVSEVDAPQVFVGHVRGSIAEHPGEGSEANQPFPWLGPNTFNAWFIAEREEVPLSDLDLHRFLEVDNRVSALLDLADVLEEYVATFNLPTVSLEEPPVPMTRRPPIVVIGLVCAGKTTFGQFLGNCRYLHVEASEILKALSGNNLTPNSPFGYLQAMKTLGSRGWDIVARQAIASLRYFIESGICITGLRTVEELNFLVHTFSDLVVVHIAAPERTRFERYVRRRRAGDDLSFERFRERAREHASFGLLSVADHCATIRVTNNSTLSDLEALAERLAETGSGIAGTSVTRRRVGAEAASRSQIYRCAAVLAAAQDALTLVDIEARQQRGDETRLVKRYALRKTLEKHPELVRAVNERNKTYKYELTEHGRSYVSLIDALRSAPIYSESEEEDRDGA